MGNFKHGFFGTRIYAIYHDMVNRCYRIKNKDYSTYGGRGIKVCDRWLVSFENFYSDMKEGYTDLLTIDRIDNDKDYSKENCRWATWKEQRNNRRPYKYKGWVFYTYKGITLNQKDWSDKIGIKVCSLTEVIKRKGIEEAFKFYENKYNIIF